MPRTSGKRKRAQSVINTPDVQSGSTSNPARPNGHKDDLPSAVSLSVLEKATAQAKVDYGLSKNTTDNYLGHIRFAKEFQQKLLKEIEATGSPAAPSSSSNATVWDPKLLAECLDHPNRLSAPFAVLCISQKCLVEGRGKSTGDQLDAALKKYWEQIPGGNYRGEYKLVNNIVSGCPGRAPEVHELVKSIRTRHLKKGAAAERHHAEAMMIEDLKAMINTSLQECSIGYVNQTLSAARTGSSVTTESWKLVLHHVRLRAFLSTAFTLWTRNFELCQLQSRDVQWNMPGSRPPHALHHKIHLENRKGWMAKHGNKASDELNHYEVYRQDETAMDCYTHLLWQKSVLETAFGRALQPTDYIFPAITPTGVAEPYSQMSPEVVQRMIDGAASAAGLNKSFTTHSPRRGGAQYRFMHAPVHERWDLRRCRWWGGWAEGEHVETLMKYLLDTLQSYESGCGDSLDPHRLQRTETFMGNSQALAPLPTYEFRNYQTQMQQMMSEMMAALNTIQLSMQNGQGFPVPMAHPFGNSTQAMPRYTGQPSASVQHSFPGTLPQTILFSHPTLQSTSQSAPVLHPTVASTSRSRASAPALIGNAPKNIPKLGRGLLLYRKALDQWEKGDASQGLLPLKDWRPEWYTGSMREVTGSTYGKRRKLYEEFTKFGKSYDAFEEAYPIARTGTLDQLEQEIRDRDPSRPKRKRSKA